MSENGSDVKTLRPHKTFEVVCLCAPLSEEPHESVKERAWEPHRFVTEKVYLVNENLADGIAFCPVHQQPVGITVTKLKAAGPQPSGGQGQPPPSK